MPNLDERLASALQLGVADNNWDRALTEIRLALYEHPAAPNALLALGVCQFHRRDFIEAIASLDRAVNVARRAVNDTTGVIPWGPIYLFRALSFAARRLPSAARADFALLRDLDPTPIRWERFGEVLRPDEITRARIAAQAAGLEAEMPPRY
jgi:tetratricopeptide (TPR) repeat protein